MNIIAIILGLIAGFFVAQFFSGKKAGEEGRLKSLKFRSGEYVLHLHHWLIGLIILAGLITIGFYNDIIYGFLTGLIIQGLSYRDFYKVVYRQ